MTNKEQEIERLLRAITREFERTIKEADRPKGGMSVPFRGDFASAVQLPSVIGRMRWWVREFRGVLGEDEKES